MSRMSSRDGFNRIDDRIDRRPDARFDINFRRWAPINSPHVDDTTDGQRLHDRAPPYPQPLSSSLDSAINNEKQDIDILQNEENETKIARKTDINAAILTKIYTISYLITFSTLGTLARLGLQALTFFPGAPVVFFELWANVAGTVIMGFLAEDRMLFKDEWGTPTYDNAIQKSKISKNNRNEDYSVDLAAAKKAHGVTKKTIPLLAGLATGFCDSFTSFSSFICDAFLALSNDLPTLLGHPTDIGPNGTSLTTETATVLMNPAFSILAVLAVLIITLSLCIQELAVGIQFAQAFEPYTPTLPFTFTRQFLDRLAVLVALGSWTAVIVLPVFPLSPSWRGIALFAFVFAPPGAVARYYLSMHFNNRIPTFPLTTFLASILGTAVLGIMFDFQHSSIATVIGCQAFQRVMDGFCGCLTTISTWIVELTTLKRRSLHLSGFSNIAIALGILVAVMGPFRWSVGFSELKCMH
ncbi:hypothetical protein G7Y89_g14283 [Cudoniella acicularis]|uniref:Chromosome condensation protein n=1 Tax=Cudoniella acicularis TaxID=354080 RepID=A0A8H4R5F5_9HELO|nr:hypothetical protein G7Y89_g14283 [Cudoniella acicularis]